MAENARVSNPGPGKINIIKKLKKAGFLTLDKSTFSKRELDD
jgi:hypothetical protein